MNGTIKMVKKDLLYLTTSVKSVVFFAFMLCLFMPFGSLPMVVAMPALMGYILVYSVMAYEERSKVELLNIALPITRKEICRAKYVESILYILVGCTLALIGSTVYLLSKFQLNTNHLIQTLGGLFVAALVVGSIYNGIILPFVFYFGVIKARYYLMFSYVIIFVAASAINNKEISIKILKLINEIGDLLPLVGIIAASCILYISYVLSLRIWNKKDFK